MLTTTNFMNCLVFQRKPCTSVLIRSRNRHTSNHITPRPNELQAVYQVYKGHDQVFLHPPLTMLRMLLKATGSTVSHIAGLATLQSCFYELAYTGHRVGFAIAKQQHHSRQMNSKYPLVIKSKCQAKEFGLSLVSGC